MSDGLKGYCSWCYEFADHDLVESNLLRRNVYRCRRCHAQTLQCRYCTNMARGRPNDETMALDDAPLLTHVQRRWDAELCAEHDGSIASFATLGKKLADLEDYKVIFQREKFNLLKAGAMTGGIVLGAAVFAPAAIIAAPGVAAALGAAGVLGTAGTGTAIATLSGAALSSASLAAIGSGTVAGGMVFLTAAGAGLGARAGGVISNGYFGDVDGFAVERLNEGRGAALIFVNGFLTQDKPDTADWRAGVRGRFSRRPWYISRWESKKLTDLGQMFALDASGAAAKTYFAKLATRATRKAGSKLNPLTWAALAADLAANPWHTAMVKASMTGVLLADLIARTAPRQYVLLGHSLGARVIAYALQALSTRRTRPLVRDVYLLGGAVDRRDKAMWRSAAGAVSGSIHNCYSGNDAVLKYAYQGANALLSDPVGLGPIEVDGPTIVNWDFSDLVDGHMSWKRVLPAVLERTTSAPPVKTTRRPTARRSHPRRGTSADVGPPA